MATAPEDPEFAKWTGPSPYMTLAPLGDLKIPIGSTSFGILPDDGKSESDIHPGTLLIPRPWSRASRPWAQTA
jgi:hypothetical protein